MLNQNNFSISVVIATYNGSKFLRTQLESILWQSIQPDEVVICDDNSTDNTVAIIEDFISSKQLTGWHLIKSEFNCGHYLNFKKCLDTVNGDLIFFSDQDDIWHNDKISTIVNLMLKNINVALAYGTSNLIDENNRVIKTGNNSLKIEMQSIENILKRWPSGYQMAITKKYQEFLLGMDVFTLNGFDFHDVLITHVAPVFGEVVKVNKVLDSHRLHEHNVTKRKNSKPLLKSKKSRIEYLNKCNDRYSSILMLIDKLGFINPLDVQHKHLKKVKKTITTRYSFTQNRIKFIDKLSVKDGFLLLVKFKLYDSYGTFISDILHSLKRK